MRNGHQASTAESSFQLSYTTLTLCLAELVELHPVGWCLVG
jgi:hypothetical protein